MFFTQRVRDLAEQVIDVSFVIDEVLALDGVATSELSGRVDEDRIGLFGLSLGSFYGVEHGAR